MIHESEVYPKAEAKRHRSEVGTYIVGGGAAGRRP